MGLSQSRGKVRRFASALLLPIAYAAMVGGIATLIAPAESASELYLSENQGIENRSPVDVDRCVRCRPRCLVAIWVLAGAQRTLVWGAVAQQFLRLREH